ncbi:MAG: tetratricopeptide repeat protein, partial [Polyangiaceae bacterium]
MTTATLRGERHRSRGNCLEAEAHLLRGLATAREFGIDSSETAGAENDLAVLYKYWGRFEQALALYSSALEKVRAIHGGDSLESATLFHNIGGVLHSRGDFAAAEQPARKAWDISRQHLGEDEPRA